MGDSLALQLLRERLDPGVVAPRSRHQQGKLHRQIVAITSITSRQKCPHLPQGIGQDIGIAVPGPEEPLEGITPGIRVPTR